LTVECLDPLCFLLDRLHSHANCVFSVLAQQMRLAHTFLLPLPPASGLRLTTLVVALFIDQTSPMNYHNAVEFEWDERKSDICFAKRGFDFAYVLRIFMDADRVVMEDTRWDYGEARYKVLGRIEQRVFCVIYTKRRFCIRIISARKANLREVKNYENHSCEN